MGIKRLHALPEYGVCAASNPDVDPQAQDQHPNDSLVREMRQIIRRIVYLARMRYAYGKGSPCYVLAKTAPTNFYKVPRVVARY